MKDKNLTQQMINNQLLQAIVISAIIASIVSMVMGDNAIWSWAIPVGVAVGAAINGGRSSQ